MDNPLDAFSARCTFPYLHGVYLAINALEDVHLLVDAPLCAFTKAEQFFATHDLMSSMLSTTSRHRVLHTRLHIDNIVDGNKGGFQSIYKRLVESPFVKCVVVSAFPMGVVIGNPYETWCDEVGTRDGLIVVHVPGKSLNVDWVEGYSDTLACLARDLPLATATPDPRKVAIVGTFMDRNEEDHRGNLRELKRLVEALDLELVSVWPGGEGIESLARVSEAGTIVSMPYGAKAARTLAERTGATLLPLEVPFGPDATARWVTAIGEACDRAGQAKRLVEAERDECDRLLERLILKRLIHGRWAFVGDPHLMPGVCEIARHVGARVRYLSSWNVKPVEWRGPDPEPPVPVLFDQNVAAVRKALADLQGDVELVIGNHELARQQILPGDVGYMEFGYPNLRNHQVFDAPFLGYRGFLWFVNRIGNIYVDQDLGFEAYNGLDGL